MQGSFTIEYPRWVERIVNFDERFHSDEDKMALVMRLATEHARAHSGGPFTAAVFQADRLVSVGMNLVELTMNPMLHGPIVALMKAHQQSNKLDLGGTRSRFELFTSSQPCGMCTPAILVSGVPRLVYSVSEKTVASALDMERASPNLELLREAGVEIKGGVLECEGRKVLQNYEQGCGSNYNPRRRSTRK